MQVSILGDSIQTSCASKLKLTADVSNATELIWKRDNQILGISSAVIEITESGIYTVYAKNSSCEVISKPVTVELAQVNKPVIEQIVGIVFCGTGALSVKAQKDIVYEWFSTNNQSIGKGNFTNIHTSGTYFVKAIGKFGCEEISNSIEVIVNSVPTAEAKADNSVICKGEILKLSAKIEQGASYKWTAKGFSVEQANVSLPYSENMPKTYILNVTRNGCTTSDTVNITVSKPITLTVRPSLPSCYGESNGGFAVSDVNSENIKVSMNGNTQEGNLVVFSNLKAGTYEIEVTNETNCQLVTKVTIANPSKENVDAGGDVVVNPWVGANHYEWFPKEGLSDATIANPVAKPSKTTTYKVIGKNENGCESTDEVTVAVINESAIIASKVLSPNGDGINDLWKIEKIEAFPNAQIVIYNRFGQEVFSKTNYQNDWDGRISSQYDKVAEGTFYYVIKIPESNQFITGSLTIITM